MVTKIPLTQVFTLQHCPKVNATILHGNTCGAAAHIAYIRFDTLLGVARGRVHGLFALEVIECRLIDKETSAAVANHKAKKSHRNEIRVRFHL